MLAGAVQGVVGFYDHTSTCRRKGKFVESVVQFSQAPGEVELVSTKHPEIKSPADFKGMTLGVTGLGSSTNFLTQYLAVQHGVKPGDFTSLPVGAGDTFIAAMQQDKIQAGMTTEPTDRAPAEDRRGASPGRHAHRRGHQGGARRHLSGGLLYMQSAWVEKHTRTTQKLANAFVKTLQLITHAQRRRDRRQDAEGLLRRRQGRLRRRRSATARPMFTPDGMMPAGGPETVLTVLSGFTKNLKGKKIDLPRPTRPSS